MKQLAFVAPIVSLALALTACSGSGGDAPPPGEPTPSGGGAPPIGSDALTLEAPERGFQLRTAGTMIEAGEDTEYCEVVAVPGDPSVEWDVNRFEIEMIAHSHHLIVSSIDEASAEYQALEVGNVERCVGAQQLVGLAGAQMIAGAQLPREERAFPPGVGLKFHGGQKLIFDYHYYNTTDEPLHTGHRMNFHAVDALEHEGKTLAFYNFSIDTPPHESASFVGECRFTEDVVVGQLTRHTHQWGRDFTVWMAGGDRDGEPVWTSHDFEEETEFQFDEPVVMKKDTGFRFQCDFVNDTDRSLPFGIKATDEMCILFGTFWEPGATPAAPQRCVMMNVDPDGVARSAALAR